METDIYFSASADIARRAGVVGSRYRTKDYRFIISDKDLGAIRLVMEPEEYINGIDVVRISETEARHLIAENGYQIGEEYVGEPSNQSVLEPEDALVPEEPVNEEPTQSSSSSDDIQTESAENDEETADTESSSSEEDAEQEDENEQTQEEE